MLGSLTLYRRLLHENVFSRPEIRRITPFAKYQDLHTLPSFGHGIAGIMAGTTVSFIAAPVEHVKARLQIQYAADKSKRMYSGPIDCTRKIVSAVHRRGTVGMILTRVASHAWTLRLISWPVRHDLLPLFLFLLVGSLRCAIPVDEGANGTIHPGH